MTSLGQCGGVQIELAVYVLGAIEPADRDALERHLPTCAGCRQELAELAGLPAQLRRVSAADTAALAAAGSGIGCGDRLPAGLLLHQLLGRAGQCRRPGSGPFS